MSKGLLLVVSAPSAGGKGTILKELLRTEGSLRMSVSATTRQPRPGEEHGKQYYFISREEFQTQAPRGPVDQWREEGLDVVLEIEVQGGAQVKKLAPDCVTVFITPPSLAVLEQRLRDRGTEDEAAILNRLETALVELGHAQEYDYIVVNDRLEDAVEDMRAILRSEKRKYERNADFIRKVITHAETIR